MQHLRQPSALTDATGPEVGAIDAGDVVARGDAGAAAAPAHGPTTSHACRHRAEEEPGAKPAAPHAAGSTQR